MRSLEDVKWVPVLVTIRDNTTGEVREYRMEEPTPYGYTYPSTYSWSVGNYSCDCNRGRFFALAKDGDRGEDPDIPCGEGRYSVQLREEKTRIVYYNEME